MQVFLRSSSFLHGHYRLMTRKCLLQSTNAVACSSYHQCSDYHRRILNPSWNDQSKYVWPPMVGPSSQIRFLNVSPVRYETEPLKPSSKVEVTVTALKEQKKEEEKKKLMAPEVEEKKPVVKKSIKERVLDELRHYYHGFRLLFIDIRISYGLLVRVLHGHSLSRREYRLLMRTVGDMFRLVPFSVFIVVPFMEFLLPFFIKFFPGMLPSTFQTATEKEDKLKQSLKVKLEMAKFLQNTLDEMSVQHKDHNSQQAKEFSEWFTRIRTSGAQVSNEEILKFSKLFQDEITLDSLSRNQLVALCRVLEVQTLGTNNLLRFQLRLKLRTLAADDKMIQKEGVDSLSLWEVQQACRARGMRAYGVSEGRLRSQLQDWLDLSLNEKVPPSLLLLSRALMLPDTIPTEDKLKATISALPDTIVNQTKYAIGEKEGKIDNKVQLDVILEEAKRVKEERLEMGETLAKAAAIKQQEAETLKDKAPIITDTTGVKPTAAEMLKPVITPPADTLHPPKEEALHTKDVEVLEDALDAISKEKKIMVEKVAIEELKEQMADYTEDVQDLKKVAVKEVRETKAAKRLFNRVNKMINNMDYLLMQLESQEKKLKTLTDATPEKEAEQLKIDEIMTAIRKIQKVPDDSRLTHIENVLSKMDDDRDGSIKVEDVLKVIEVIGKENVHLSAKQVDELLELLDKEEILEVEKKIEKTLKKELEIKLSEKEAAKREATGEATEESGYDKKQSFTTSTTTTAATPKVVPPSTKGQESKHGQ